MASYKQPVIPEIAKAFENDPRTRLAQQAIATGVSTAPVAQGGWAWADGIARALQGGIGGYMQKQQLKKYAADEAELLAKRQADGTKGLEAIAGALGAPQPSPAPMTPPQAPQPAPGAPIAPQAAPAPQAQPVEAFRPIPAGPITPIDPNTALGGAPGMPPAQAPRDPMQRTPPGVGFVHPLGGKGRTTGQYGDARPGRTHNGLDMAIEAGTPVVAAGGGRVLKAWNDTKNGGGNSVLIRHEDGSTTGYAHLSAFNVKSGDPVQPGQPIGAVGSTGRSSGPHLHFTYRDPSGKRVNPASLKFGEGTLNAPATAAPAGAGTPLELPPEPAAMARPEAPSAEGPVTSSRLRRALELMAGGNRYESAAAQEMYDKGLGEQTNLDENAAGRRQSVKDTGYNADLQAFNTDRSQRSAAAWDARKDVRQRGYVVEDREDTQQFTATENEKNFARDMSKAGFDRDTSLMLARLNNDAEWRRTQATIEASRATVADKAAAKRTAFFSTPTGAKIYDAATQRIQANGATLDKLNEFEALNKKRGTGGMVLGNVPSLVRWSDGDLQSMERISQDLSISLSGALKGAISDKEGERILRSLPTITNKGSANRAAIRDTRAALNRAVDFETRKLEAMANGTQVDFIRQWDKFRNDVSIHSPLTYEQYIALPQVGKPK